MTLGFNMTENGENGTKKTGVRTTLLNEVMECSPCFGHAGTACRIEIHYPEVSERKSLF
jgi:hypothetical protein